VAHEVADRAGVQKHVDRDHDHQHQREDPRDQKLQQVAGEADQVLRPGQQVPLQLAERAVLGGGQPQVDATVVQPPLQVLQRLVGAVDVGGDVLAELLDLVPDRVRQEDGAGREGGPEADVDERHRDPARHSGALDQANHRVEDQGQDAGDGEDEQDGAGGDGDRPHRQQQQRKRHQLNPAGHHHPPDDRRRLRGFGCRRGGLVRLGYLVDVGSRPRFTGLPFSHPLAPRPTVPG
jgi:hypothetical protein